MADARDEGGLRDRQRINVSEGDDMVCYLVDLFPRDKPVPVDLGGGHFMT